MLAEPKDKNTWQTSDCAALVDLSCLPQNLNTEKGSKLQKES